MEDQETAYWNKLAALHAGDLGDPFAKQSWEDDPATAPPVIR